MYIIYVSEGVLYKKHVYIPQSIVSKKSIPLVLVPKQVLYQHQYQNISNNVQL